MELFTKSNVVHMLQNNVVTVRFQKVDGTERVMKCTLLPEYLPNTGSGGLNAVLLQEDASPNIISVWDVEANGWRSFRVNNLKSVTVG
jgi:hypothetical protein